jgi:DtxR family Mn-dependent transcriptional regulator
MLSEAAEDYLKAIFELLQEGQKEVVSTSELARTLGVSRASVSGMLKKLAEASPKLIDYQRYRGAALTARGKQVALEVIRHHRLIECYLADSLGYSWDEVHGEADRLEHVISEDLGERIAAALGEPQVDPHGSPIPARDGTLPEVAERRLSEVPCGERVIISRVSDHDAKLLRYLEQLDLTLNQTIEVLEQGAFEGPLFVRVVETGAVHALNPGVTDHVFTTRGAPQARVGN